MPSSSSEARSRVGLLALVLLPLWACATGVDNAPAGSSSLEAGGDASDGGSASSSAGSGSSASAGKSSAGSANGAAGSGASGASSQSGAPGSAGSAGKAGASSAGSSAGGASSAGSAGKAGATSGGASSGGSAGSGVAGSGVAGTGSGGATGGTTCDAAHSVATLVSTQLYTGKANDCVRLAVNPTWATVAVKFQPQPGTASYPVPFSFFSCGGNGTGSLTTDYVDAPIKSGANPGCDIFVQFEGGATTIKVIYYN